MPSHPFNDRSEWKMCINGEFVKGHATEALSIYNSATGELLGEVAGATKEDIDDAVSAARAAYRSWRWLAPEKRARLLFAIADRIAEHQSELVDLETWENGKPRSQSLLDVQNAERTFRFYAGATDKFYGQAVLDGYEETRKIVYEPYGVVAVIIPWNWPPMHTADFAAISLATGNTVVMKPAPETPLSSLRIAELAADILPPGVFNVTPGGVDAGVELVRHPDIDFIAFTGSDLTGAKILAAAAQRITPTMMELGGKNASLIFPDANLDRVIAGMHRSAFFNSGQACSGTERILVHEDIYAEFQRRFVEQIKNTCVGEGFDDGSQVGPMISQRQQQRIAAAIDRATEQGAKITAQSALPEGSRFKNGFWIAPTLLEGAQNSSDVMTTEVFGPVPCLCSFREEDEAVELANAVDYGLTAGVWTTNLGRAHRVAARLEAGSVAVNCVNTGRLGLPFGGYKRSGVGRKKDFIEAMRTFSQVKAVQISLKD